MTGSRGYAILSQSQPEELKKGACVGISPYQADLFHGTRKDQRLAAQLYCDVCPVIEACAKAKKQAGALARGSLWAGQISGGERRNKPSLSDEDKFPRPARSETTSPYRGVSWQARAERWVVHLRDGNKTKYVGSYEGTPEGEIAAARAWDAAAMELRGRNTFLNFPPSKTPVSQYRGVSWAKRDGRWVARLRLGNKSKFVGSYPGTPEGEIQAAELWDQAAVAYLGKGTYRNFPER